VILSPAASRPDRDHLAIGTQGPLRGLSIQIQLALKYVVFCSPENLSLKLVRLAQAVYIPVQQTWRHG